MKLAKSRNSEQRRIEEILSKQERRIQDAFAEYLRNVQSGEVLRRVREFLEAGNIAAALGVLDTYIAAMASILPAIILDVGRAEAETLRGLFRKYEPTVAISFDPGNPRAAAIMQRSRLEFIQNFTAQQREATRIAVQEALSRGASPLQAAREFRASIGLTASQERWVAKYRRLLESGDATDLRSVLNRDLRDRRFDRTIQAAIEGRRSLTAAQIDRMVARYRERALAYRSEVISRTEGLRAIGQAREEALTQSLELTGIEPERVVQEWRSAGDGRVRDAHRSMNGQKKPKDEPFISPSGARLRYPGDPDAPISETAQCRCTLNTIILPPNGV